jgi:hypothetical protein
MTCSMITLRDGYQVRQELLYKTTMKLEEISRKSSTAFVALIKKSRDERVVITDTSQEKSKTLLKNSNLIDDAGNIVDEDVRRIVTNSFKDVNQAIKWHNPVKVYRL